MKNGNGSAIVVDSAPLARGAVGFSGSARIDSMEDVFRLADALARAEGFIPAALLGKPNAIAACILTGLELGMGPMEAMRTIHIVKGRATMAAEAMLGRAIRAGVRVEWPVSNTTIATISLQRGDAKHTHSFTIQEAQQAGLASGDNWKKYPAAMLRARCVSAAMRAFCPDVLGAGVYVEGEIEDTKPTRVEVVATPKATLDDIASTAHGAIIDAFDAAKTKEQYDRANAAAKNAWSSLGKEAQMVVKAARETAVLRIKAAAAKREEIAAADDAERDESDNPADPHGAEASGQ